jgi:hypothetical protein
VDDHPGAGKPGIVLLASFARQTFARAIVSSTTNADGDPARSILQVAAD